MFYGALVLAKKGPLAKVWLAAHWDKKLTKAHVFETDVESTVDDIISPQVKMALRTSGHLLLGVVRIYSRKQKYLIHDLGEACAKIKMAFRPGSVDLPSEGRVDNPDAITLPEIFHNFETSVVADLGSLDLDAGTFTVSPSKAAEITIAENFTSGSRGLGRDMFDGLYMFNGLLEEELGGSMEDIEVQRNTRSIGFGDDKDMYTTDENDMQVSNVANHTTLPVLDGGKKGAVEFTLEDRPFDAINDFGEGPDFLDGFGAGDEGMVDLGDLPGVSDINLEEEPLTDKDADKETLMDVDQDGQQVDAQQHSPPPPAAEDISLAYGDATLVEGETNNIAAITVQQEDEYEFVLEPVNVTGMEEKSKTKRKRRLLVDKEKDISGLQIRSLFEDFEDLLRPKCFPPPTKKAFLWKQKTSCEQLFSNPTTPLCPELSNLIKRNYTTSIPGEPDTDNLELNRAGEVEGATDLTVRETMFPEEEITDDGLPTTVSDREDGMMGGEFDLDLGGGDMRSFAIDHELEGDVRQENVSRAIPDMPELNIDDLSQGQSTEEQQSEELSEEFERCRWNKCTQKVIRVLDRDLSNKDCVDFSSLTQKCTRKQAASRFYTCLLLAKEGMVDVEQSEPYGEIVIHKGPKFAQ